MFGGRKNTLEYFRGKEWEEGRDNYYIIIAGTNEGGWGAGGGRRWVEGDI